jgi:hypothetical protein
LQQNIYQIPEPSDRLSPNISELVFKTATLTALEGRPMLQTGLMVIFILATLNQAPLAGATDSFPAMLAGGSRGVPLSLPGTLHLSGARLEFEAFPQVENVTLPCATIKAASFARGNKNVITIVSAGATYRFDLYSGPQSQQFMTTLTSNCKISSKSLLPGQN